MVSKPVLIGGVVAGTIGISAAALYLMTKNVDASGSSDTQTQEQDCSSHDYITKTESNTTWWNWQFADKYVLDHKYKGVGIYKATRVYTGFAAWIDSSTASQTNDVNDLHQWIDQACGGASYSAPGTLKTHVSNGSGISWSGDQLSIPTNGSAKINGGTTGVTIKIRRFTESRTKGMNALGQWSGPTGWSTRVSESTFKVKPGKWTILSGVPESGWFCDHREGWPKSWCTHQKTERQSFGITMVEEKAAPEVDYNPLTCEWQSTIG